MGEPDVGAGEHPLGRWLSALAAELDIAGRVDLAAERDALLEMTRDVAHGVARPAAPLSSYLVGVAVGAGLPVDEALRRVQALAAGWSESAAG